MVRVPLCVLVLSVACGGAPPRVVQPEPTLTVADPGAEPRQLLRYELTAHAPERTEVDTKMRMSSALQAGRYTVEAPTVQTFSRMEVVSIEPNGDAAVRSEVEQVKVLDDTSDPAIRKAAEAQTAGMKAMRSSWHMAPSGRISGITVAAPNAAAGMRRTLEGLGDTVADIGVVFPVVPIGVGASWQLVSEYVQAGVTWQRAIKYHLKEVTPTTATVDEEVAMRAGSQVLAVEPNATTRLASGTMTITGEMVVPLHGLVATGTAQGIGELDLELERGGHRAPSSLHSEITTSVKPAN